MLPSALTLHCWLGCPVQSQITTGVPSAVPRPDASRHLLPYTTSCLPERAHDWLVWPLQFDSCSWVPLPLPPLGTSRQRPDWLPMTATPLPAPPGGPALGGPTVGGRRDRR